MTPERALVAARNSEIDEWRWWTDGTLAHQYGAQYGWQASRCPESVRWTVQMRRAGRDDPRCPACSEMSEAGIEREAAAIMAVADVPSGASESELRYLWGDR